MKGRFPESIQQLLRAAVVEFQVGQEPFMASVGRWMEGFVLSELSASNLQRTPRLPVRPAEPRITMLNAYRERIKAIVLEHAGATARTVMPCTQLFRT